ncbi:MAG: molecular chaperone [Myxococcota bacterium]
MSSSPLSSEGPLLSLEERAPLYAWLAPFFAQEIDAEVWAHLKTPSIATLFAPFDDDLSSWTNQPFTETLNETCAAEFARLFLLPGGVPPLASVWIQGDREKLGAELSAVVARSCEVLSRTPQRGEAWGKLPLDHIGLIFDLASRAGVSTDPLDREVGAHLDEAMLGTSLARFGAALEEKAELPVYRALGRCVKELHARS